MSSDSLLAELVAGLSEVHEKLVARAREAEEKARLLGSELAAVAAARDERQERVEELLDLLRDQETAGHQVQEALEKARKEAQDHYRVAASYQKELLMHRRAQKLAPEVEQDQQAEAERRLVLYGLAKALEATRGTPAWDNDDRALEWFTLLDRAQKLVPSLELAR